ncbi:hypothetical protein TRAPUB_7689 [Trametes pubescens]|uniref:Uncharacterized protein n=1 Tax=Trametes pubescens TaxID=154538 RepID=A0A1M2V2T6_TRAPU|nr:hypothetical protein TRAPUB_7689 [Trametes pubescens]
MSIEVAALAATQHQQTSAALGAPDEWLGHDYDVETPVYLLVYPSSASYGSPAYSPWSIAWPVGGATEQRMTAWRHLQVDACTYLVDSDDPPCFGYQGPFTKTAGSSAARRLFLFNATLTTRQTIEQLAKRACSGSDYGPAAVLQDGSKEWVKGVLDSMVASGLMSGVKRDMVVQLASAGTFNIQVVLKIR